MDDPREILKAAGVECAEVEAYTVERFESPEPTYTMVRQSVADAAILALAKLVASLCRCGNCEHRHNEYDHEDWWVECTIHGEPGFAPEDGRETYMPEKVEYDDECHFAESRWQSREDGGG